MRALIYAGRETERVTRLDLGTWRNSMSAALGLGILLFGLVARANAQISSPAWLDAVPCNKSLKKDDFAKKAGISQYNQDFMFCFDFDEKELYPDLNGQVRQVDLIITSYAPLGQRNVDSLDAQIDKDADHPGVSIEKLLTTEPGPRQEGPVSRKEYPFRLNIASNAKPTLYYLRLSVTYQHGKTGQQSFKLPLAAPAGDWLEIDSRQQALSCWTGKDCQIKFFLLNKLYCHVEVTGATITSDPTDLVEDNPTDFKPQLIRTGSQSQALNLLVRAKPMSLSGVFSGFGKSPHVLVTLNYKDQYGREFSSKPQTLPLQMRPNVFVLTITVLLGVALGTLIRIDLRRLEKSGLITRKQRFVFAGTTVAAGIIVSLVALFTNLKMVVFEDQSTYSTWDPRMLFLTGLVGTIGGIPILYSLLRLPKPPGTKPKEEEQAPRA